MADGKTRQRISRNRKVRSSPEVKAPINSWKRVLLSGRQVHVTSGYWTYSRMRAGAHTGVDIAAGLNAPVNLPIGGKVVQAGRDGAFGLSVTVQMPDGAYFKVAHLNSIAVSKGQTLKAGAYLGAVGSTGNSSGPHLHVEVRTKASGGSFGGRESWRFVDPIAYLNKKKTSGVSPAERTEAIPPPKPKPKPKPTPASTASFTETSTAITNDGGFGAMAKSGFNKKDFYAALSSMFGSIDTLMALDKESRAQIGGKSIKWAVDQMVKDKITDSSRARTILMETGWFKKYGEETTQRLVAERQRPEVFKQEASQLLASINTYLTEEGVTLTDAVKKQLARNAYVYGWEDARIKEEIKKSSGVGTEARQDTLTSKFNSLGIQLSEAAMDRIAEISWRYGWTDETLIDEVQALGENDVTYTGGSIAKGIEDVTTFADDYGVKLTDADLRQFRNDFLDNLGDQRIKETIQKRAAQTYAVFADQILAGQSTRALASAYFDTAAELLEVDADAIKWDDPLFAGGKAFTAVDPNTGKQVQKGLWDFEKEARQDSRWMTTQNARDSMIKSTAGLLNTMGLV